jgi:hypothetical protein
MTSVAQLQLFHDDSTEQTVTADMEEVEMMTSELNLQGLYQLKGIG